MTHITIEREALESLILKAGMNPVMQGSCYVMHPEALQAVIDEAIKQALAAPAQEPLGKLCVFDDADSEFGWSYDISGNAEQHRRLKELDGAMLYTTPPAAPVHPDDLAVDSFAAAMKVKLAKQRAKGYGGWSNKDECPTERLQTMLAEHLAKGDPVDVGNFAMMLWARRESTATPPPTSQRQWVGLTLADREKLRDQFEGWNYPAILVDAVVDILKEKNK
jgi:hypothetical protein